MDELEKLLNKLTVKFPVPLEFGEIEGKLFEYLKSEAHCTIDYTLVIKGHKSPGRKSERYAYEINGSIRCVEGEITTAPFRMSRDRNDNFVDIKIDSVPGYDSIEEFKTLPSGSGQLGLADYLRKTTENYFLQRPKRTK